VAQGAQHLAEKDEGRYRTEALSRLAKFAEGTRAHRQKRKGRQGEDS
jgi:hypothetical protein